MRVEFYLDILCPWCYIAERRLDAALIRIDDPSVTVLLRAVELGPDLSGVPGPTAAEEMSRADWWGAEASQRIALIRELGEIEGIELNLHLARPVNTFDAHRLIHLAQDHGLGRKTLGLLLAGYQSHGLNIADHEVLSRIGSESGLPDADLEELLGGDRFADQVRFDQHEASRLGIAGVPAMQFDDTQLVKDVLTTDEIETRIRRAVAWTPTLIIEDLDRLG